MAFTLKWFRFFGFLNNSRFDGFRSFHTSFVLPSATSSSLPFWM